MHIRTKRLTLRPFEQSDADAVRALAGNWNVARMVSVIPHPYPERLAAAWIDGHPAARERGAAYPFAITLDGAVIGAIGLNRIDSGRYMLGYWIGEPWWGLGFATEAARAIVRFARDTLALSALDSTHLFENPASGRVLAKCGFVRTGETMRWCESRGRTLKCHCLTLALNGCATQAADRSAER
jgi:ribosomal-protein-alanine N-acetyltransferase